MLTIVGEDVLDDRGCIRLPKVKGDWGDEECADGGDGKAFGVTLGR